MRTFHLSDILSVTTGRLVSTRHIEGVYDILNHMTGDSLFTHQLPRAATVCGPAILKQHPQLAEIEFAHVSGDNWKLWLDEQIRKFGTELPIAKLVTGEYEPQDPIIECLDMMAKGEHK